MQSRKPDVKIGTFQIAETSTIGHVVFDGKKTSVRLSSTEFYRFTVRWIPKVNPI